MIPVNVSGTAVMAYLARNIAPTEGEPRYFWPKGFLRSEFLFGAYELKEKARVKVLFVVE